MTREKALHPAAISREEKRKTCSLVMQSRRWLDEKDPGAGGLSTEGGKGGGKEHGGIVRAFRRGVKELNQPEGGPPGKQGYSCLRPGGKRGL